MILTERMPNKSTVREKLEAYSWAVTECGCWIWLMSADKHGYGYFHIDAVSVKAHRASYEEYNGPVPKGMLVCHRCDTPACINPEHLFVGTYKDNAEDMVKKGRQSRKKGERIGTSKLLESEVREISLLLQHSQLAQGAIAEKFKVNQRTISEINIGKRWTHVTEVTDTPIRTVVYRKTSTPYSHQNYTRDEKKLP